MKICILHLTLELVLKDPISILSKSFKMHQEQTYRNASCYIGWMRGMLKCNNSLSLLIQVNALIKHNTIIVFTSIYLGDVD